MYQNQDHNKIRAEQQAHARMMGDDEIATVTPRVMSRTTLALARKSPQKHDAPKGHEAFIRALEVSGAIVTFEKASNGEKITGKIKTSDKYTVSIQSVEGTRVLFKHDISEFFVKTRPKTDTN